MHLGPFLLMWALIRNLHYRPLYFVRDKTAPHIDVIVSMKIDILTVTKTWLTKSQACLV